VTRRPSRVSQRCDYSACGRAHGAARCPHCRVSRGEEPRQGLRTGGYRDNAGAFLGPLIAVALLIALKVDIRWVFYLAIIPGLLAVLMVLLVKESPAPVTAKAKIDLSLSQFSRAYWRYLLATALFGLGNFLRDPQRTCTRPI